MLLDFMFAFSIALPRSLLAASSCLLFPKINRGSLSLSLSGNTAGWYEGVNAGSYEVVSTTNAGIKIFVLRKYTADSYLVIAHHRDLLVLKGSFPGFSLKTTLIFP